MLPASCSLSAAELDQQLERYRRAGAGGRVIEHGTRHMVLDVGPSARDDLVEQLISTERSCCPFFELTWDPGTRRLTVGVARAEHEAALSAIAAAITSDRGRARE